jgi:hypothetical protein
MSFVKHRGHGWASGIFIDKNDMLCVSDSES